MKNENKMTEVGIGRRLVLVSFSYFFIVVILYSNYPSIFLLPQAFFEIYVIVGITLIFFGFIMYVLGASVVKKAFREDRLITDGVYGIVRNPMYSGLTIFFSTGIAFILGSWLLLTVPIIAYFSFKYLIKKEENYLEHKFGQDYINYRLHVNSLIPFPRFLKKNTRK